MLWVYSCLGGKSDFKKGQYVLWMITELNTASQICCRQPDCVDVAQGQQGAEPGVVVAIPRHSCLGQDHNSLSQPVLVQRRLEWLTQESRCPISLAGHQLEP